LRLFDSGRTSSIDGFDVQAAFGSGAAFQASDWVLTVDGIPVDLDVFGHLHLETLPVSIDEIEEVTWEPGPVLVAGRLVQGGVLRAATERTAPPDRPPVAGQGTVMIGNETGDPGPWRYTDRGSPNVDKWGTDLEAAAQIGRTRQRQLRVGARWLRHFATDPAALRRNQAVLEAQDGPPRMRLGSASVRGDLVALGVRQHVALFGTYLNDLSFYAPTSQEQPVRRLFGQAAFDGGMRLSNHAVLGVHLRHAVTDLDARDDAVVSFDPLDSRVRTLGWQQDRTVGRLVLRYPERGTHLGATVTRETYEDGTRRSGLDTRLAVDGAMAAKWNRVDALIQSTVSVDAEGTGYGVLLRLNHPLGRHERGDAVWLDLGAARTLASEQDPYAFSLARDDFGLAPTAYAYAFDAPASRTDVSARLSARGPVLGTVVANAAFGWRWADGLFVEDRAFTVDPNGIPTSGLVTAVPDAQGHVVHATLALMHEAAWLQTRAFYDGQVAQGSAAFDHAWSAVPRHRAGLRSTARLDRSFTAQAALTVESGARWTAYDGLATTTSGVYDATLPTRWLLDVGFNKTLWRERIRVHLGARNLLNAEERTHPLGAALDLRLFARASVRLASLGPAP
ncbi:MAG: hypothetical protein AAF809_06095, partial [Bacteroidota bacterium]